MLLNDLSEDIAKISRAINKYSYVIGFSREEMYMLERVTSDTESIMNVDKDEVVTILRKVYEALYSGRIQMKDSERYAKNVLALIDSISKYIVELRKYKNLLDDIESRITKYTTRLHELNTMLESTRKDIKEAEDRILSYSRSLESLKGSIGNDINEIKNKASIILAKDAVIVI
jgi:chromosome segregation ATPase